MSLTSAQRDRENKEYLTREVNDILEPMMLEVVKQKPENNVSKFKLLYFYRYHS